MSSGMIPDSALISLTLKLFSKEVKCEPIMTLGTPQGRSEGGSGPTKSWQVISAGCVFLGQKEAEQPSAFIVDDDN